VTPLDCVLVGVLLVCGLAAFLNYFVTK